MGMNILVVDLDESLIKTDILYEQVLSYIKKNPLHIFKLLAWLLLKGPLGLKMELSLVITPNVEILPYREDVLQIIKEKKKQNHTVILASASPHAWVEKVAAHLGLFDHIIGSQKINLKGQKKYQHIAQNVGSERFLYIGDSVSDLPIWRQCGAAIAVNASPKMLDFLKKESLLVAEISDKKPKFAILVKQMRVHQWVKNALLFLPLIAAHKFQPELIFKVLIGFFSFGFAASAIYVFNDLIDIDSDRKHRSKKNRPLAAGALRIQNAIYLFTVLIAIALVTAFKVGPQFVLVIAVYWLMNILYTFYFKKEVILDIILLSGMYTVRIFAGAAAASVIVSHWLLSFSTLFFFSLACIKRFTELIRSQNKLRLDGRGYRGLDQTVIQTLGVGTGLLSILVVLLYLQSPEVKSLYSDANGLWLLTPILLYWLGRLWILTSRDKVHDDPVIFAVKDKVSWICLALILATMSFAA